MTNRVGTSARRLVLVALALGALPARAEAHLVTTGLGPVYDGISHVFVSPEDLIPIVVMALLAGLNGQAAGRGALFALTSAWLVGGIVGLAVGHPIASVAPTVSFLLLGALIAADPRLSPRVISAIAVGVGLVHGWLNGAGIAAAQRDGSGLVGIGIAIFVILTLVTAMAVPVRAGWIRLVLRVAGSWVAAIGLLMLGWTLRGSLSWG